MLISALPPNPSMDQLRKQAKEFHKDVRTGHPKFVNVVREALPRLAGQGSGPEHWAGFTLAQAQQVIAHWYGFASWPRLRTYVAQVAAYSRAPHRQPVTGDPVAEFLQLACLSYRSRHLVGAAADGDDQRRIAQAHAILAARPELASTDIFTAATVGELSTTSALLAEDPSLATKEGGPYRWPPLLYLACSRVSGPSTVDVARLLIERGADPNAGYLSDGEPPPITVLSGAFHGRRDPVSQPAHPYGLQLARLLLQAGANPNDEQAVGNACGYPYDDAGLALLLEHGLGRAGHDDPWRARLGPHPAQSDPVRLVEQELLTAAERNLVDRARLLIPHCRSLAAAHDSAVRVGNTEIAELLAAAGAPARVLPPVERFVAACLRSDRTEAHGLLATDPDLVGQAVRTVWPSPLQQAAFLNRPDAIRLLVSVGFPVNDRQGWPLHTAAMAGHLEAVTALIDLGCDPEAELVDETPGQFCPADATPLGWARYNGQHEVVALLTRLLR